jgi:integrase
VKLLDAAIARGDDQLADLIRLGMWTGCRIEELCALKVEQVKGDYFAVEDAKTKAGWRDVPIHSELRQAMARLVDQSKDGCVLSGLTVNKYGDRSNGIGKRFGRMKASLGFGPQHVFHSIRKTVVTILENASVPENIVADIVGHEKTTMTYGLYSGGVSLAVKRDALDKLAY